MLPSCCQGTELPGEGHWAAALSLWTTEPGAGDAYGCEEEACEGRGQDLRRGRGVTGEDMSGTCSGAEVEAESEGGLWSWRKGAGLGDQRDQRDQGTLKVWV